MRCSICVRSDVGKVGYRRHRRADHHRAERDVADEVAFARVAGRSVVLELFELADVVQQRAGGQQILVRAVGRAQGERRSRDRQDVLEKTAPVRVVHRQRSRPDAQLLGVLRGDALQQLAHERIADVQDELLELAPHLFDRARRTQHAVFLAEALPLVLVGIHPADLLDEQLHPSVEQIGPPLHFDEVAAVELFAKAGRFVEDTRPSRGLCGPAATAR